MKESTGADTGKKYHIQWRCAALYMAEMLVNEKSNIKAVICESDDDFTVETENNTKIVFQVTHVNDERPFGLRNEKMKKTLKNFSTLFANNNNIDKFVLISNSHLRGVDKNEVIINDIVNATERKFYEKELNVNDTMLTDLLKKTHFLHLKLDILEDKINTLVGKRFNLKFDISAKIGSKINEIARQASISEPIQEVEYRRFQNSSSIDSNHINLLDHKRITKDDLKKNLTVTFGDIFSDKGRIIELLDRKDLIAKGVMVYDEYSLIRIRREPSNLCWENSYFKLTDILNNLDVRRHYIKEIIDSILLNKGTILLGYPYSGKSTILRRLIVELVKDYRILYLDKTIETTFSSLMNVFMHMESEIEGKILVIIDNFHDKNAIEIIKFFNEFESSNIKFLFASQIDLFNVISEGKKHDEMSEIEIFNRDVGKISINLGERDCLEFYDKLREIYNRQERIEDICEELIDRIGGNMRDLIWILRDYVMADNKIPIKKLSYLECAEKEFNQMTFKIYENHLEDQAIVCLILNSVGINLTKQIIDLTLLDYSKLQQLESLHVLVKKDDGHLGIRHELWGYNLINYIIKTKFDSLESFQKRFLVKEQFNKAIGFLNLNELIMTIRRIALITKDGFLLGQFLTKSIDINRFNDKEKSEILNFGLSYFYSVIDDIIEVKNSFEESIRLDEKNFDSFNNYATFLENEGDIGGALKLYETAIENKANIPEIYYNSGRLLQNIDFDEALIRLFKSIELDDDYSYSYSVAGNIFVYKHLTDDSEMFYKIALDLNENDDVAWMGLANIIREKLRDSHKYEPIPWSFRDVQKIEFNEMMSYYEIAVNKNPDSSNILKGWMNMAKALQEFGSFNDSIQYLDMVIDNSMLSNVRSKREIAALNEMKLEALKSKYANYVFTHRPEQALRETLEQMLDLDENDPETLLLWSKFKRKYSGENKAN
jgi:tetratricopeptide (TPR) repeat protein